MSNQHTAPHPAQQELAQVKALVTELVAAKRAAAANERLHKQSHDGILGGPLWEKYRRAVQRLRDAEDAIVTVHDSWEKQ